MAKRQAKNSTEDSIIGWATLVALIVLVIKSFAPVPPGTTYNLYQEKKQVDTNTTQQTQPLLTPDDEKQITCLSKNIYYEARNQSDTGKLAVALVTFNRLHSGYADNVCNVVYQKTVHKKHTVWQFSWVGEHHDFAKREPAAWSRCYTIAHAAYVKQIVKNHPIQDLTGGAHFYYAHLQIKAPHWAHTHTRTAAIGDHWFYR